MSVYARFSWRAGSFFTRRRRDMASASGDHASMNTLMFRRMRSAIQSNASPGRDDQLQTVEEALREVLMESGLFEEVEVEHTDDPDRLVIALCQFRPFLTAGDVARRLEQIWADRVRYPFWEAHALQTETDFVELEAATRASSDAPYVTLHLVAQKAHIPSQRPATT